VFLQTKWRVLYVNKHYVTRHCLYVRYPCLKIHERRYVTQRYVTHGAWCIVPDG